MLPFRKAAKRTATELEAPVAEARRLAEKLGLEPYDVNYWIVDHDEMNQLFAYDGFQRRYPHWRWGMKYDRRSKQDQFGMGRAYEMVNNDDPAHAFLQESNDVADQKAVVTHVEAHSDFFANNEWFLKFADGPGRDGSPDAAAMLERHARTIESYMTDPEIDRHEVERWIDHVLCLESAIDQHAAYRRDDGSAEKPAFAEAPEELAEKLAELDLSDEVREEVFDEEFLERQADDGEHTTVPAEPAKDLLAFLGTYGKQYDAEAGKAVEMEPWQRDVVEMLRAESYYFAPQRMTKVMNEGWAAYWESIMMGEEAFAGDDEFVDYADHQSRVLASPGLNPYSLGKELWEYVENTENRRMVCDLLLRVDGITWRTFHDEVDFDRVMEILEPTPPLDAITPETVGDLADLPDRKVDHAALDRALTGDLDVDRYPWKVLTYEGLAERHFSLVKPQYRRFLERVRRDELERLARYMFDDAKYASVAEALADVQYTRGWDRMYEIRESHNDVTFLDEFLSQEFVDANDYFTYEFVHSSGDYRVTSTDYEDVKKKLLLQFTNFGKPQVVVLDGNYRNRNELLLGHRYNGVMLDVEQAKRTLERVFELWGRPVNLLTVVKEVDEHDLEVAKRRNAEPDPSEQGRRIRYDGEEFGEEDVAWEEVEDIAAEDVDYDTKPDEWLA